MRRALASLSLVLLSYPLIAPVLLASTETRLPPCCRLNGKHRCSAASMSSMSADAPVIDQGSAPDSALNALRPRCPYYPATSTVPVESNTALPRNSRAISTSLAGDLAAQTADETPHCMSFSRSRQERGPPAPLS